MKLLKLYSNKNFHNIQFSENGLNVVLGNITDKTVKEKDTHNLGKSLLCELIDFMLLKKITKKSYFLTQDENFEGYVFFLEISLNENHYLIIRRATDEPSKICFLESNEKLTTYKTDFEEWTYENIPFMTAVEQLNKYLQFDILPEYSYRKYINYFLRQQPDYSDVFHLSKYKGSNYEWKDFLFVLLGYDDYLLKEKEEIEKEIEEKKTEKKFLSSRVSNDGDQDGTKALIELKEQELKEKQELADKFDFSKEDSGEHKRLIENIDTKLQIANTQLYELNRDIERISSSLKAEIKQIDVNELKEIFEETKVNMPEFVFIDFSQLLEFNRRLSTERNHYLKEQLMKMQTELPIVKTEIENLQKQRADSLSFLTQIDSYDKYKEVQAKIGLLQSQISELKAKSERISGYKSDIQNLNEEIAELQLKLQNNAVATSKMLEEVKHAKIRNLFNEIIKKVLNVNGIISLNVNTSGNIEFDAKVQNPETLSITSKDSGFTYRKMLCIAFDLAILINYADKNFIRFAYHDGALEGLDDRKKIAFIDYSRQICLKYGLQQIITLIDSDLPLLPDGSTYSFNDDEIILRLSDKSPKDKLFMCDF